MGKFFDNILGDKNVFKSMTAWGLFLFEMGSPIVDAAVGAGFITADGGDTLEGWLGKVAVILTGLGIRKAVGKKA